MTLSRVTFNLQFIGEEVEVLEVVVVEVMVVVVVEVMVLEVMMERRC